MKMLLTFFGFILCIQSQAQDTIPSADVQIKMALMAAPADKRDGAAVFGYSADGKFTELRKGSNEMICLADDPKTPGLSVACYHKDLEPFMARGRELRSSGKTAVEMNQIRDNEGAAKTLKMPAQSAALYVYTSKAGDYSAETGDVKKGYLRYVIYVPFATAQSTGLPIRPEVPGMPWIMDPGTYKAHVMISPPATP